MTPKVIGPTWILEVFRATPDTLDVCFPVFLPASSTASFLNSIAHELLTSGIWKADAAGLPVWAEAFPVPFAFAFLVPFAFAFAFPVPFADESVIGLPFLRRA
ncbi:hypothetical protein IMZ11_15950 [Microtetraspora sp. AC03309]|uniref:hypothetical protein n=1 Tax=Microtetraspora sp. AC03309 TaxID=2779376 RepID=UPI001E541838|nr:hypothetical protein [Microtetraspora sp. AC03309]MCC5577119.1 hypothetical protein [Microtetraspora sp. AC03309]